MSGMTERKLSLNSYCSFFDIAADEQADNILCLQSAHGEQHRKATQEWYNTLAC